MTCHRQLSYFALSVHVRMIPSPIVLWQWFEIPVAFERRGVGVETWVCHVGIRNQFTGNVFEEVEVSI